ncbi:hypothetical protein B0H11DRAFT_2264478 [Mycena galericulata]|nr:hypothetical protein B0H11DRAFT_2264478 [Mycena galericulata]
MDSQPSPTLPENPSAIGTEYYSAAPSAPANDAVSSGDVAPHAIDNLDPVVRVTLHTDENGSPYIVDEHGQRMRIVNHDRLSSVSRAGTSTPDDAVGVPAHHCTLFSTGTGPSSESNLSESERIGIPPDTNSDTRSPSLPALDLDIDPDMLSHAQIRQLNAIRGHLGAANSRLATTTAIIAEHQTVTERLRESIVETRREVISRIDSLRNEVTSQRSRLNRCLDDNLRTMRETGASGAQISELLQAISTGKKVLQKAPIIPLDQPALSVPLISTIPSAVLAAAKIALPPRADNETADAFDARADATLRTKDQTFAAFPLPSVDVAAPAVLPPAPTAKLAPRFELLNAYKAAGSLDRHPDHIERAADMGDYRREKARTAAAASLSIGRGALDSISTMRGVPAGMNNSASGYHVNAANEHGVIEDFANDMEGLIRQTIEHRVGTKVELPPGVRTPKIDNPPRFRRQDGHDHFMMFLEKLLVWMRAGCYCGPDLDDYRIVLLQGVLDEEALRWFITEIDNPRLSGEIDLEFADVICAMHRRYVKSATAQRATRDFETVTWDSDKGPEGLYSELITRGQRMVEMPSQFVLKSRFMKLLPNWLSKELRLRRGLTIEFSTLETLRSHARQMWETDQGIRAEEAAEGRPTTRQDTGGVRFAPREQRTTRTFSTPRTDRPKEHARDLRTPSQVPPTSINCAPPQTIPNSGKLDKKVCFSCGGDHYARDKICPNYSEQRPTTQRVAMQRVVESYPDEDSEDQYEGSSRSGEEEEMPDQRTPDLNELLEESEDLRLNSMHERPRLQYYSSRIVTSDDELDELANTETSISDSSVNEEEVQAPFGNYNPGPLCIVCSDCALVIRRLPATPENGLLRDQTYTVCEHLANIGLDSNRITLPVSPQVPTESRDETEDSDPVVLPELDTIYASTYDGPPLNWLGDPDLPPGVLIDIEEPSFARTAVDDVRDHDAMRVRDGHPPLTALEFYINLNWVRRYRSYGSEDDAEEERTSYERALHEEMRHDATYGPSTRARDAVKAEELAHMDEVRINMRRSGTLTVLEPALATFATTLGQRSQAYELEMRILDRRVQATIYRRWLRDAEGRRTNIEQELISPGNTRELWLEALNTNTEGQTRMIYEFSLITGEIEALRAQRTN